MDKPFDEFQPKSEFYYDRGDRYEFKKKPQQFLLSVIKPKWYRSLKLA